MSAEEAPPKLVRLPFRMAEFEATLVAALVITVGGLWAIPVVGYRGKASAKNVKINTATDTFLIKHRIMPPSFLIFCKPPKGLGLP